jgi:hypothetical protein
LPPFTRPAPAETSEDQAHGSSQTGARLLPLTQPPPAEANSDRAHGNSRTVPVYRHAPTTPSRGWNRSQNAATPRRVPGHRYPRNPPRPKPEKTLRAATSGRVSPFPLHQLTIEWTDVMIRRMCQTTSRSRNRDRSRRHACARPSDTPTDHGPVHDRSGRSASHTAQLSLIFYRVAMRTPRRQTTPRCCHHNASSLSCNRGSSRKRP